MANIIQNLISQVKAKGAAAPPASTSAPAPTPTLGTSGIPQRRYTGIRNNIAKAFRKSPVSKSVSKSLTMPVRPEPISFAAEPRGNQSGMPSYLKSIPEMHKGGKVKKTGIVLLKKGETVLTPEQAKRVKNRINSSKVLAGNKFDNISSLPITATPVAYFVRHGDTDMNDDDLFRGDYDPPLNESGQAQARLLKLFFNHVSPSAIYHSTRLRTKQTVEPLAKSKNLKPILNSNLDSLDTGNFAGKPKDKENKKKMKWYREHPDAKIPGGQTVRGFQDNADGAFAHLLEEGSSKAGKPIVAGVHGSIIKELGRYLHGDIKAAHVEPGGVVGVYKLPSGAYVAKPLLLENFGDEELDLDS